MDATGMLPEWLRGLFDGYYVKSEPLMAASAAWMEMSQQLEEMSAELMSVLTTLEAAWEGTSSLAMIARATPFALWMSVAGMEAAGNSAMAFAQGTNYETGDLVIPQLEEIVATRVLLEHSYGANAAAWGMLSGWVAANEEEMERCTIQTLLEFANYDGATQVTSLDFPFTLFPPLTSMSFHSEAMFSATIASTMARIAPGVASQAVTDAILASATAQVAAELGMEPVRMITPFAADALGLFDMVQGHEHVGLSERIHEDLARQEQNKEEGRANDSSQMGREAMQQGAQVGSQVMQGVNSLMNAGQQAGQQVVQEGQQIIQQGQQMGQQLSQQIMQMVSHAGSEAGSQATTFSNPAMSGQYSTGYTAGFGGGLTSPMGAGGGSSIRVPSSWGGASPTLGLGVPASSKIKLDAGSMRGSSLASAGSSLSNGGSGGGMGNGVQGVAQAAHKKQNQEEKEEEHNNQYQIPDQFADGRVVTPPVIGASEKARA